MNRTVWKFYSQTARHLDDVICSEKPADRDKLAIIQFIETGLLYDLMEDEPKIKIRLIQISVTSAPNYAIYVRMEFVTPFRIQTKIKNFQNFSKKKTKLQKSQIEKLRILIKVSQPQIVRASPRRLCRKGYEAVRFL